MSCQEPDPVPFNRLGDFIRQVTHDVRNGLNAVDLQTAYLSEIATEAEVQEELGRLREMVRDVTKALQTLSRYFQEPHPDAISCPGEMLVDSLKGRVSDRFPDVAGRIVWRDAADAASARVDVEKLIEVFLELIRNSVDFGDGGVAIEVETSTADDDYILEIREKKPRPPTAPETWGREVLVSSRRGGYGLGLFRARALLGVQRGILKQHYDEDRREVVSQIILPRADDES